MIIHDDRFSQILKTISAAKEKSDAMSLMICGKKLDLNFEKIEGDVYWQAQPRISNIRYLFSAVSATESSFLKSYESDYDSVSLPETYCPTHILFPWLHRVELPGNLQDYDALIEKELTFWKLHWQCCSKNKAGIIQVAYDLPDANYQGYHISSRKRFNGLTSLLRELNQELERNLPDGSFFLDLRSISANEGRRSFYDLRNYHWSKDPFSVSGSLILAEHIYAAWKSLNGQSKKVIVLDLDNTLWGGVLGEVGPEGIDIGDTPSGMAYIHFQKVLKRLKEQGFLLAVCSKNNESDVEELFLQNSHMVLKKDDFVCIKADWRNKSEVIREMSQELSLGLDQFVFLDDNPVERNEMRSINPDVLTVEMPEDPAEFCQKMFNSLALEQLSFSQNDSKRTDTYHNEQKRKELGQSLGDMQTFMKSLGMRGVIRSIENEDLLMRASQLLQRTNQFNLCSNRYPEDVLRNKVESKDYIHLILKVNDRFGEYGEIALITGEVKNGEAIIDNFVVSCRILGRTAECYLHNHFLEMVNSRNVETVSFTYVPNGKNMQVEGYIKQFGYKCVAEDEDGSRQYMACVQDILFLPSYIERGEENEN
jgi:FkbH-like protein